ncbi:MAG: trigger factor [Candidatus Lindowbacteria bacterium]|nr:trigger factor [Candidatus Lindowbacteria bacterium]
MKLEEMNVNRENGTAVVMTFQVPVDEIGTFMGRAVQSVTSSVQIPGFRRGKAPRAMIEEQYGMRVHALAEQFILDNVMPVALKEAELIDEDILQTPSLKRVSDFDPKEPFKLEASLTIAPKFKLADYKGIKIKKKSTDSTDDQVDAEISRIVEQSTMYSTADRPAENDDMVIVSSKAKDEEGNEVKAMTFVDLNFVLGKTTFPKDFQKEITGMKEGEKKEFELSIEDDYAVEPLRGKKLAMDIEVSAVKARQSPEVDDELAKTVGYDDLKALKEAISTFVTQNNEQDARKDQYKTILEELRSRNPLDDLPEAVLQEEIRARWERFTHMTKQMGIDEDRYFSESGESREAMTKTIKDESEKHVHSMLVMRAIAKEEKLEVTQEDLVRVAVATAQSQGQNPEAFMKNLSEQGRIGDLKNECMEQKILHFLHESAEVE